MFVYYCRFTVAGPFTKNNNKPEDQTLPVTTISKTFSSRKLIIISIIDDGWLKVLRKHTCGKLENFSSTPKKITNMLETFLIPFEQLPYMFACSLLKKFK